MPIHIVNYGDNIDNIAAEYNVDTSVIIYDNQLVYPYQLAVGQALFIAGEEEEDRPVLLTSGYAYPFISPWVLQQTLPYLNELYVFSYGFTTQGELIPPYEDDTWMIEQARDYGVKSILTLTPFDETGNFNNNLISAVVNDEQAKNNLIWNTIQKITEKGYAGADIDFEYVKREDRDAFSVFVREFTEALNDYGYQVSVALAPKISSTQQGLLYEGKDYGAIGAYANRTFLMTYEWGYTYGSPMAVAPLNQVERVVDYAVTQIPVNKITMGIPNYGYDWPLPYERGVTKARTIGNVEAVRIAVEHSAVIQFDTVAASPYFHYEENGVWHEVWFEDVRSIQDKLVLAQEKGLLGIGYWQLMRFFRASWVLFESMFRKS